MTTFLPSILGHPPYTHLAAAVQPEGGALVRRVRSPRRGGAGAAHLAAVRADHLDQDVNVTTYFRL